MRKATRSTTKRREMAGTLNLRLISPKRPEDATELAELREDLKEVGCVGFFDKPWELRHKPMVRELLAKQKNVWDKTVRAKPEEWTTKHWQKTYNLAATGKGLAARTDRFVDGKFSSPVNPKEGYLVADCKDRRERAVLEFLGPILYPDRPNRITVTMANTILGAMGGKRKVDWGTIVKEMVRKLVPGVGKAKPSPISPFLFHLYKQLELLTDEEESMYESTRVQVLYGVIPNPDPEEEENVPDPDSERESLDSEEERQLLKTAHKKKRKSTPRSEEGTPPMKRQKTSTGSGSLTSGRFRKAVEEVGAAQEAYEKMEELVRDLCLMVNAEPKTLQAELKKALQPPPPSEDLKKKVSRLSRKVTDLEIEVEEEKEKARKSKVSANESASSLMHIRKFINNPGDVVGKAMLFDQKFEGENLGPKIVTFLVDYSQKLERTLGEMREVVDRICTDPDIPKPALPALPVLPEVKPEVKIITVPEIIPVPESRPVEGIEPIPAVPGKRDSIQTEDLPSLGQYPLGSLDTLIPAKLDAAGLSPGSKHVSPGSITRGQQRRESGEGSKGGEVSTGKPESSQGKSKPPPETPTRKLHSIKEKKNIVLSDSEEGSSDAKEKERKPRNSESEEEELLTGDESETEPESPKRRKKRKTTRGKVGMKTPQKGGRGK